MYSAIVQAMADARLNGVKLQTEAGPPPRDLDAAYAMQDAMTAAMGLPIAGWKIGATTKAVQQMLNCDGPFAGPMFDRWIYPAPNRIPTPDGSLNIVEIEFAFRMAKDLPYRAAPYSEEEVADAVAAVHPGIEIVDRRLPGPITVDARWLAADGGANHAFTYGKGREDWRDLDLASLSVTVSMGGKTIGTGSAADTLGSPFNVLMFLTDTLHHRKIGMKAGAFVTTGVVTPVFTGDRGAQIVADFDALGRVETIII